MSEDDKQQYYDKQKSFENTYQNKESIYEGNSLQKSKTSFYDINTLTKKTLNQGRFPANTILTYDKTDFDEVCGGFPEGGRNGSITKRYEMNNMVYGDYGSCNTWEAYADEGSASRYFYCAKASKKDRDEGLEEFEEKKGIRSNAPRVNEEIKTQLRKNVHPTVKPVELMQYLIRLVTPKNGVVLDPFMGSGSTGKATMFENRERNANYKFIGIELNKEYIDIANARIFYALHEFVYDENITNIEEAKQIHRKKKGIMLW